jgi:Predicted hydrolase (HAD superfamily)
MLTSLFTQINWSSVRAVGFDLDGTLYDEFDFISQVYPACLEGCASFLESASLARGRDFLLTRWLEKGSSYPHLLEEVFALCGGRPNEREDFIRQALEIFRTFRPNLKLPFRSAFILSQCRRRWPIFLITDGREKLQGAKFDSLGLAAYFPEERRCFTGALPDGSAKPSPAAYDHLGLPYSGREVAFFGDREVDQKFAAALGFQFTRVAVMNSVI